jgi:ABC-type antimicrobial peptide transport system ATPase subunit
MENESKGGYTTELPVEIQKMLKNLDFPIERNGIIEQARKSKAIPDILRELGMLPDKNYNSAEDIAEELHKVYMGVPA